MKKFAIQIHWSQTDWETVLVNANTEEEAVEKITEKLGGHYGFNHISGITEIVREIF